MISVRKTLTENQNQNFLTSMNMVLSASSDGPEGLSNEALLEKSTSNEALIHSTSTANNIRVRLLPTDGAADHAWPSFQTTHNLLCDDPPRPSFRDLMVTSLREHGLPPPDEAAALATPQYPPSFFFDPTAVSQFDPFAAAIACFDEDQNNNGGKRVPHKRHRPDVLEPQDLSSAGLPEPKKKKKNTSWFGNNANHRLSVDKPERPRPHIYGELEEVPLGMWWASRLECSYAGVHRPTICGISPGDEGAYSICMSGGYDENEDFGDWFWYCGAGGRELKGTEENPTAKRTAPQTKDMDWSRTNTSLLKSMETGNPIRVVRGYCKKKGMESKYAPSSGYRYDGLYRVTHWEQIIGKAGFSVLRFQFVRIDGQDPILL